VDRLRADRALAERMGAAGRRYVLDNFEWPMVIDRYLEAFHRWKKAGAEASSLEPEPAPRRRSGATG
jgi:hypothetical protein